MLDVVIRQLSDGSHDRRGNVRQSSVGVFVTSKTYLVG
jgi:hypothetical protein